jgi:hypothetical protein
MKKINMLLVLAIVAAFLVGCDVERTEYENSGIMTESATVVDLVYMPKNHGSSIGPTIDMNLRFGVALSDVDMPEKYAIVFECQHGKFVVEHDQVKMKGLYQMLHRDQKVIVTYQEVYEVTKKGGEIVTPRKLVKFHFIDARPMPPPDLLENK